jgi:hypothetical protein
MLQKMQLSYPVQEHCRLKADAAARKRMSVSAIWTICFSANGTVVETELFQTNEWWFTMRNWRMSLTLK